MRLKSIKSVPQSGRHLTYTSPLKITGQWPVWGLHLNALHDKAKNAIQQDSELHSQTVIPVIPMWGSTTFDWKITATKRGEFPRSQPYIQTGFPFGLYHARKDLELNRKIIIWPEVYHLSALPDTQDVHLSSEKFSDRKVGDAGDLLGTRTYRQGDSLRRVHWAQTARNGQIIVTERQAPVTTSLTLYPDLYAEHHVFTEMVNSYESTIALTASMCQLLYSQHGVVTCLVGDEYISCQSSEHDYKKIMDALALLPPEGLPKGKSVLNRRASSKIPRSSIEITTDLSTASSMSNNPDRKRIVLLTSAGNHSKSTHNWITLKIDELRTKELARNWKRACHVA